MSKANPKSIQFSGAEIGDVVEGLEPVNRGLLLRLKQEQPKHLGGALVGRFEVLAAGSGHNSSYIKLFEGQTYNPSEPTALLLASMNPQQNKSMGRLTIFNRNLMGVRSQ